MSKYCYYCGKDVSDDDKFCHHCGKKIEAVKAAPAQGKTAGVNAADGARPAASRVKQEPAQPGETKVRYVQVDTRTGKIADPARQGKSGSESMMQGLTIAFVAIAVVLVMVAGSMFIAGHMKENIVAGEDSSSAVVSQASEPADEVVSEPEPVSSEISSEISSEEVDEVPPELKADYLRSKLKGTWNAKIPYKSMSLPATFIFDDKGSCHCVIKALFITKQFDGQYSVEDGGQCRVTLNGLEEYMPQGNTLSGQMAFVDDDHVNFTVGKDIWTLNRAE